VWLAATFPDLTNLQPIDLGGQRWVYRGQHSQEGEIVLKIVKPGQDPERIRREVNAVAAISSQHIPAIRSHGVVATNLGPCVWIREQRIDGSNLAAMLLAGPLGQAELVVLARDLLTALQDSELVRIVHRDVKPSNLMRDLNGRYWLLDFGLARDLNLQSLTPTASRFGVGTFGYSAPEQMRNLKPKIDSRADLFAAGITLYEAATGANPFRVGARDDLEILRRTERLPLPALRLSFDRQGSFSDLVSAMTQKYPDQRPRTVAVALDWLQQITTGMP
jgi:serine/threonine-protein kinase